MKLPGSQDTATTTGTRDAAISMACSFAPARGGSKTAKSAPARSPAGTGRRIRLRVSVTERRKPGLPACRAEVGDGGLVDIGGVNGTAPPDQRQRERARTAEQVGGPRRAFRRFENEAGEHRLAIRGCLGEAAGRQRDGDTAMDRAHRPGLRQHLRALLLRMGARHPGEPLAGQQIHQRVPARAAEPGNGADQQVDAAVGHGDMGVRPVAGLQRRFRPRAQRRDQRRDLRQHHRTGAEIDDAMAVALVETDDGVLAPPPDGEGGAPPAAGRAEVQRFDRRVVQPVTGKQVAQQVRFPRAVGRRRQMLQGAAAALAEMGAGRLPSIRPGLQQLQQPAAEPAGAGLGQRDGRPVARRGRRHMDRPARHCGHAVAAPAEGLDGHVGPESGHISPPATAR